MANLIGESLGGYRILEPLGTGGMAEVYKAYQPSMDRYVAIKVIKPEKVQDETFLERFRREARAVSRLEHLHILPVYDYGQDRGRHYLVMRYMDWGTLKDRMAQGPMPLPDVVRISSQVGNALAYAHRRDIYHRDIKPSNILMDEEGNAFLTDFGVAKMMEVSVQLTGTGVGVGTPAYMSPEQGQGRTMDGRSDVYSLGVMLYEMVVGQKPYRATTPLAVVYMHIHEPLPLPRHARPDVPEAVERVILKAMAKDPDDRFQTADEMVDALAAVEAPPTELTPTTSTAGEAAPSALRRLPWKIIGPVAGVILIAALAAWLAGVTPDRSVPPTPDYATAREVSVDLGAANEERGLRQFDAASDGISEAAEIGGKEARVTVPAGMAARYLYFDADRDFLFAQETHLRITVEYFDQGELYFSLNYDSTDASGGDGGAYKGALRDVPLADSGRWRTATFDLPDAYFGGRQHSGADFRIATGDNDLYINAVTVTRAIMP